MIDQTKLLIGNRYFVVSFFDDELQIPNVETYIYVGKSLLPTDRDNNLECWYFQSPDSFLKVGVFTSKENGGKVLTADDVLCADRETLEMIYDISGLIDLFSELNVCDQ